MAYDEYDVEFFAKGSREQIDALVMAANMEGFWPALEKHVTGYGFDGQWVLRYCALNEKFWDVKDVANNGAKLVELAKKMNLETHYAVNRCWSRA